MTVKINPDLTDSDILEALRDAYQTGSSYEMGGPNAEDEQQCVVRLMGMLGMEVPPTKHVRARCQEGAHETERAIFHSCQEWEHRVTKTHQCTCGYRWTA